MTERAKTETGSASELPASLLVPRRLVKTVKTALETHSCLSKAQKIRSVETTGGESDGDTFIIPMRAWPEHVNFRDGVEESGSTDLLSLLAILGLAEYAAGIKMIDNTMYGDQSRRMLENETIDDGRSKKPLLQVMDEWKSLCLENEDPASQIGLADEVLDVHTCTYMIYPPLLLLPPSIFSQWPSNYMRTSFQNDAQSLYRLLCSKFQVTHIALNGPITPDVPSANISPAGTKDERSTANILRSPTNLTPLHGDFGPLLPTTHQPSPSDFSQAFWCTARQNKIFQKWAPRYTMFSRGNISEKARVLRMDTLKAPRLGCSPEETSAVDLYAGVGYFAFSYAKVGVGKVLCWEINPWSVEGLRRGARGNGWGVVDGRQVEGTKSDEVEGIRFLLFEEGNEHAANAVAALRTRTPPIRHVNCGFLPSSRDSWKTAVEVLDPMCGGWIHVHENIAKKDIGVRTFEVVKIFEGLVDELHGSEIKRVVTCEHVERVKSYAPGVIHSVLDICITPSITLT